MCTGFLGLGRRSRLIMTQNNSNFGIGSVHDHKRELLEVLRTRIELETRMDMQKRVQIKEQSDILLGMCNLPSMSLDNECPRGIPTYLLVYAE